MKLHITATGFELDRELEKYATKKALLVGRKVPRKVRPQASCTVAFSLVHSKKVKYNTCTVTLAYDDAQFSAEETTQHMYAALDIAVVHVEQQLKDHLRRSRKRHMQSHLRHPFGSGNWL
jgi:ribosomal subunit interface protein